MERNFIGPDAIVALKQQYFFQNGMHFYKNPPQLVRGEMQYLFDHDGKRYTDFFAGVTVANCGHCNPVISEAVAAQAKTLAHTSIIYLTEPMVQLAKSLAEIMPGDINRTFFCCSGTEANEGAMLLARLHTGRKGFLAFKGGLHGRSALTMSVTGIPMWRIDPFLLEDVYFADCYHKPGEDSKVVSEQVLAQIDQILDEHGDHIAACIIEPLQGNGGIMVPHPEFLKALKKKLEAKGVLLIADEVQTGFGRTGKFFAVEHFGVIPDLLTMAKALGNGQPVAAFAATEAVAKSMTKPSASTLGGNPVSMEAGRAVLNYMEEAKLVSRSQILGEQLKAGLQSLADRYPLIREVRGLGLMIGVEMRDRFDSKDTQSLVATGAQIVDQILEHMKDRGFIIGKNGMDRNVLAFQPPLVIEANDISDMLSALDEVLGQL